MSKIFEYIVVNLYADDDHMHMEPAESRRLCTQLSDFFINKLRRIDFFRHLLLLVSPLFEITVGLKLTCLI